MFPLRIDRPITAFSPFFASPFSLIDAATGTSHASVAARCADDLPLLILLYLANTIVRAIIGYAQNARQKRIHPFVYHRLPLATNTMPLTPGAAVLLLSYCFSLIGDGF